MMEAYEAITWPVRLAQEEAHGDRARGAVTALGC